MYIYIYIYIFQHDTIASIYQYTHKRIKLSIHFIHNGMRITRKTYNKAGYNCLKLRHNRPLVLDDYVWAILSEGDYVRLPQIVGCRVTMQ